MGNSNENDPQLCETIETLTVKRGHKEIVPPRLVAALDNAKLSDGMAIHILIATVEAMGYRPDDFIINRSSIYRQRKAYRAKESDERIQDEFYENVI